MVILWTYNTNAIYAQISIRYIITYNDTRKLIYRVYNTLRLKIQRSYTRAFDDTNLIIFILFIFFLIQSLYNKHGNYYSMSVCPSDRFVTITTLLTDHILQLTILMKMLIIPSFLITVTRTDTCFKKKIIYYFNLEYLRLP